ncbi:hypothetical protein GGX14DRAFT_593968 [Mycena pura]|uniref:Uncharacterized protein n=1 Tax=Mycena pura TaxID=153505 RepID=A0AAD6UR61_9AGAR|nr:hypothetical protein GGX14DRAFT_593968 [Mycena pura]
MSAAAHEPLPPLAVSPLQCRLSCTSPSRTTFLKVHRPASSSLYSISAAPTSLLSLNLRTIAHAVVSAGDARAMHEMRAMLTPWPFYVHGMVIMKGPRAPQASIYSRWARRNLFLNYLQNNNVPTARSTINVWKRGHDPVEMTASTHSSICRPVSLLLSASLLHPAALNAHGNEITPVFYVPRSLHAAGVVYLGCGPAHARYGALGTRVAYALLGDVAACSRYDRALLDCSLPVPSLIGAARCPPSSPAGYVPQPAEQRIGPLPCRIMSFLTHYLCF